MSPQLSTFFLHRPIYTLWVRMADKTVFPTLRGSNFLPHQYSNMDQRPEETLVVQDLRDVQNRWQLLFPNVDPGARSIYDCVFRQSIFASAFRQASIKALKPWSVQKESSKALWIISHLWVTSSVQKVGNIVFTHAIESTFITAAVYAGGWNSWWPAASGDPWRAGRFRNLL